MANKLNMITGVAALALVFGAGPAFAQYGTTGQGNSQGATSTNANTTADQDFAKKAAQGDMAEVKLGQLAEQKGSNQAVKDFGRRMMQDHSKNDKELNGVASKANLALPAQLDKSDQDTYDHLSKLSGDAFDRAYSRDMVKDHMKDIADFQKEAKDGQNEAIKNYAAQTVPTLQSHLDQARHMEQAVNQSSNTAPTDR